MNSFEKVFVQAFDITAREIHEIAISKGWYQPGEIRNPAERIALIHSELSEALEFFRHGNRQSDHIPLFSGAEEELADVVIRCMDFAVERNWKLGEAIAAKIEFNKTRPHKHGGKLF